MDLHVRALYEHDANGRIVASNEPDPAPAPRLYLGRTSSRNHWRFHAELSDQLVRRLDLLLQREPVVADLTRPPVALPAVQAALAAHGPSDDIWSGPAWSFPDEIAQPASVIDVTTDHLDLLRKNFGYTADHFGVVQPCTAVVVDGDAVALCSSVRLTDQAAEAGVSTTEPFRGHGYAADVTAAWAIAIRRTGRIPLYSTSWHNTASRRVAEKLGLIMYGSDFSIG